MAGSINLSLAQQFDITNGRLLSAGKLYFFSPGTTTPQNAFRDSGLTLPHPNPITLASDGRVPQLYFADGSIRCRLLNKDGIVQFDSDNILVVGPSSGGGGGGGATDPNAIFQTGDVVWQETTGIRAGWVRDNGRTIGSATSGASERANVDCLNLFLYGWAAGFATGWTIGWSVVTGPGASALADWGANKQITLPDKRGYIAGGVTDMGNADSLRLASVPFSVGSATAAGSLCGEARHALTVAELASHLHNINWQAQGVQANGAGPLQGLTQINSGGTTGGGTSNTTGSDQPHNNTPLTVLGTFYRKL